MQQVVFHVKPEDDLDLLVFAEDQTSYVSIKPCNFKRIFSSILSTKRYLIYISSNVLDNDIKQINLVLNEQRNASTIPIENVTIINELKVLKESRIVFVELTKGRNTFGKIDNIIAIYPGDNKMKNLIPISCRQMRPNRGIYYVKTLKLDFDKDWSIFLDDQWWYNYYNNIPQCARGRLVQFSGTCWFNSAFNSILLTPTTRQLLINQYQNLPQHTKKNIEAMSISSCFSNTPLDQKLWFIIYKLYIERVRLTSDNGDFTQNLAAQLKSMIGTPRQINKKYGDGGDPCEAIKVLSNNILPKDVTQVTYGSYSKSFNEIQKLKCDTKKILDVIKKQIELKVKQYNSKYSNAMDPYNESGVNQKTLACSARRQLQNYKDKNIKYNTFYLEYALNASIMVICQIKLSNLLIDVDEEIITNAQNFDKNITTLQSLMSVSQKKQIEISDNTSIFIYIPIILSDTLALELKNKNKIYKLEAAVLRVYFIDETTNEHTFHVVTGLRCYDEYYIYDSNNIIVKGNWQTSIGLIDKLNQPAWITEYRAKTGKQFIYRGPNYGIYLLQNSNGGKVTKSK